MSDDLRERCSIVVAGKIITVEPYSRSTYKLEIDGVPIKDFSASVPPLGRAFEALNASGIFEEQKILDAIKDSGWSSHMVDVGPEDEQ